MKARHAPEPGEFIPTEPAVIHTHPGESPEVIGRLVLEAYRLSPQFPEVIVRFEKANGTSRK